MSQAGEINTEMEQAASSAMHKAAKGARARAFLRYARQQPAPATESDRNNAEAAAEECQQALDAIVAMFPALDILADRASRAAGYGSPLYDRIIGAFFSIERGIDMLRRPVE